MLAREATAFFQATQIIHTFIAHKRAKLNRLINSKPRAATDAFVLVLLLRRSTRPPTQELIAG
jgi:hypothetical protein